VEEVRTFRKVP